MVRGFNWVEGSRLLLGCVQQPSAALWSVDVPPPPRTHTQILTPLHPQPAQSVARPSSASCSQCQSKPASLTSAGRICGCRWRVQPAEVRCHLPLCRLLPPVAARVAAAVLPPGHPPTAPSPFIHPLSPPPPALLPPSRNRYDCAGTIGVNPREIATRIMSIRSQIAKEFVQELKQVSEENSALMRETLVNSFSLTTTLEVEPGVVGDGGTHPEMVHPDFTDNSAIGADD